MATRKETAQIHERIVDYLRSHNTDTYAEISAVLGVPIATLSRLAVKAGLRRKARGANYALVIHAPLHTTSDEILLEANKRVE